MEKKPGILVHLCCAPDALYVVSLLQESYEVTGFFYNPNIHPEEEYLLRLAETRKVADHLKFRLIEGDYDPESWLRLTEKFKNEPEKGRRCLICFAWRLDRTARKALEENIPLFTTIMSISPWKDAAVLNRIGRMTARKYRLEFLEANFKKKDGFNRSVIMSREFGLYRQNYCGCLYSRRPEKS
ncbi:MAG: epoxyqueuosine reductase QueH [Candidatus Saccharicenans sp.]|nr:epoxyqueuosine reductase QueH [Candidatus Saccharicenans sp.]